MTRLGVGLLVLEAIVLAGCSEGSKSGTGPPPVTYSIAITAPDSTLMVGQTIQLAATLTRSDGLPAGSATIATRRK